MKKNPEVEAAKAVIAANLRFVVQSRSPSLRGVLSVWHTRTEFGTIRGKMQAYRVMEAAAREEDPSIEWRVLPQSEADRYTQGLRTGVALAKIDPSIILH